MCQYGVGSRNSCQFKDIHHNNTFFEFSALLPTNSYFVSIKNSTIQKLGRFGICKSTFNFVDDNNVRKLNLTNIAVEEIHKDAFEGCDLMTTIILRNNQSSFLRHLPVYFTLMCCLVSSIISVFHKINKNDKNSV